MADELAKIGSRMSTSSLPTALSPHSALTCTLLYRTWRRLVKFDKGLYNYQVPDVSLEELLLPRKVRCALSRLRCNGHSLLLASYQKRIGRAESPSCSACGHPLQDLSHTLLHCPALDSLRSAIFGNTISISDLWSRPWGVARMLGLSGVPPLPHPQEGVG